MVKVKRTPEPPESLAKQSGDCYRDPDVVALLRKDFHEKCYLCERDELQSIEVEHLRPHGGDQTLKYQWENLFYSCSHCNSVKNQSRYDGKILDCCRKDPESVIHHTLQNGHVSVKPLDPQNQDETVFMTAQLLTECFEKKNTGIRIAECETLMRALNATMNTLYRTLEGYKETKSHEDLDCLAVMLDRTYKFSGFTRAYVRTHLAEYPALTEYVVAELDHV